MWKQKQPQVKATEVYQNCSRSVVKIDTLRRGPCGDHHGNGSDFVWDRDRSLLVTCHHVIHEAFYIRATIDDGIGTQYKAEVVFSDPNRDLALLCVVDAPKDKLKPISSGDSASVRVGDEVFVIGSPFGYDNSLTHGIIRAIHREIRLYGDGVTMKGMMQTDAAINPGNSGGPLFDRSGTLIGMVTCIKASSSNTSTGVGLAIPVNVISEFVKESLWMHYLGNGSLGYGNIPNSDIGLSTMGSQPGYAPPTFCCDGPGYVEHGYVNQEYLMEPQMPFYMNPCPQPPPIYMKPCPQPPPIYMKPCPQPLSIYMNPYPPPSSIYMNPCAPPPPMI